jgi:hypothetical protein
MNQLDLSYLTNEAKKSNLESFNIAIDWCENIVFYDRDTKNYYYVDNNFDISGMDYILFKSSKDLFNHIKIFFILDL